MTFFEILNSLRAHRGMKVSDFMRSFGMSRPTWYLWREGSPPSQRTLADIERALHIRFLYDGDEIIGWESVSSSDIDLIRQMSYTSASDPHGGGSGEQSAAGDSRVLLMYREDSEGTGLPEWDALSKTQREFVRNSYLALLQNMQKEMARRRMELVDELRDTLTTETGS